MSIAEKDNKFDEEVFSYKVFKDNKIFIYWLGKQVKILRGKDSEKFLSKIEDADFEEEQLVMAKLTGNFKRGNERLAKSKSRR